MAFSDVVGQEKIAHMFRSALKRGRLGHAYVFSGPDRRGMKQMALELSKAINCTAAGEEACDRCVNCVRIAHGNHPDVHVIAPDGKSVKIEQMRTLQRRAAYHAMEAAMTVVIIEAAETMTLQAANSLLKFLEEPADKVIAILLTENSHALLPTVVSRCQFVPFQYVPSEKLSEQLIDEGMARERAAAAARLASGLEEARQLAKETWFASAMQLTTQLTHAMCEGAGKALIVVQEQLMKSEVGRTHLESFLDLMILWYRDMLNIKLGCSQPLTFLEQTDDLKQQVTKWTEPGLVHAIENLIFAKRELKAHVAPQLVVEGWVLSVQEG